MTDNVRAGCPVDQYASDGPRRGPLEHFERLDALRSRNRPFFWTTTAQGYFVFTDHDAIVDGLQHPEIFSSSAVVPEMPDPSPAPSSPGSAWSRPPLRPPPRTPRARLTRRACPISPRRARRTRSWPSCRPS